MPLLIDTFLNNLQATTNSILSKQNDPFVKSGMTAVRQAALLCDKIVFNESTMKMLIDKLRNPEETIREVMAIMGETSLQEAMPHVMARLQKDLPAFRGAWVEFYKPINTVAAILTFCPATYMKTGKDRMQLYLIGRDAEIIDIAEGGAGASSLDWSWNPLLHSCPRCQREMGLLIPCAECLSLLDTWGKIMGMSKIIVGQHLASHRYEEKTYTGMRREKREHSNKERRIPTKYTFKVIDANEIVIPIAKEETTVNAPRGSWKDGNEIYEEITTRPFSRTYRHPRYVNVQGQTVNFPNGIKRLQPKKPEMIGKVVTKVRASLYEEQS